MAEIYVTSNADSGAGSLRQAIAAANDGDVIQFDATVFPSGTTTAILLSSTLNIPKNIEIDGGGRVALDGQNAIRVCSPTASSGRAAHLKGLTIKNGAYANGAGVLLQYGAPVLTDCIIERCTATSNGGAIYATSTSQATLNDCTIDNCSANNGGGVYARDTSVNTLNDCIITNCSATTNGGGVYAYGATRNTLNGCTINGCSATNNAGGVYSTSTSQNTLNDCTITGCNATNSGGLRAADTSQTTLNGCTFDALSTVDILNTSALTITGGITTISAATIGATTITIADGAALTITDAATIGTATLTSDGRGYLATAAGIDLSAATLNNVVSCEYGAGLTAFDAEIDAYAGLATWTQTDATKTILLEADSGSGYATLTQSAAGSYAFTTPSPTTYKFLAFDGERFFRKTVTRTYYYIGGAEGSFTSASDWSLTSGGAAISAAPTVKDCKFIIE